MSYKVNITLKGDWDAKSFEEFRQRLIPAAIGALEDSAEAYADELKVSIVRGSASPSLTIGTLIKRSMGKKRGAPDSKSPFAISPYPGNKPLFRSGALARSIITFKKAKYTRYVMVRRGSRSHQGENLEMIAALHESGFAVRQEITERMRAYLLILYGEIKPKGTGAFKPGTPTGRQLSVRVQPRPIWQETSRAFGRRWARFHTRALQRRLGGTIKGML